MADPGLKMSEVRKQPAGHVEVAAEDLQGPGVVFCPNPKMPLWSNHPRVFIDVASTGLGKCPYCGTVYKFDGGRVAEKH
jgi:uncharacterized Zn-finger protein